MANELDTLEKFLKTSINEDNSNNLENGISNGSKQVRKAKKDEGNFHNIHWVLAEIIK